MKNLKYLPLNYADKVYKINEFVDDKTNWGKLKTEKVTLINADIKGEKLKLLKSLKNIISLNKPVLVICAYHKAEDLVELPKCIREIINDYCFVLRKYESNVENIRKTAELVLYAIPVERICINNKFKCIFFL